MNKGFDYTGVCVVFICHDGQGNYLFQKRSNKCRDEHGCWDIGGGGIEFGDTIEETLRKEILEECGTDVLEYEFLGYRDVHREHDGKNTHWIALDFKVLVDKEKAHNAEPHKFEDFGWFDKDNFPEPRHSQFPIFLDNYKDKI